MCWWAIASHRGPAKVAVWIRAPWSHYLFLDDPRTQRVVGEPQRRQPEVHQPICKARASPSCKEFHFPHKRAAMVVLEREAFFEQYGPGERAMNAPC